jgi:hypothetical protein
MSKTSECLLQSILDELRILRQHLVPPPLPTPDELEQTLTRVLGVGPDDAFNK